MTTNHPAHGPVSLDRLYQISEILSKAAAQSDGGNLGYAMADAVKVIDGVLSIPATLPCPVHLEPVLKFGKGVRTQCVLDALRRRADYYAELEDMTPEQRAEHDAGISEFKSMLGNGSRDAMLQSFGNSEQLEPLSHGEKLPMDYLQGHKDGLEWAAQLALANHPQTGDWLYDDPIELARAIRKGPDMPPVQTGNSPVTPDGWIPVSERMPEGMKTVITSNGFDIGQGWWDGECWKSFDCHYVVPGKVTHWIPLPAAPQQEVKS